MFTNRVIVLHGLTQRKLNNRKKEWKFFVCRIVIKIKVTEERGSHNLKNVGHGKGGE